jgi:hypothetical protein
VHEIQANITIDRPMSGIHSRRDEKDSHAELNIQLSNGKHWHFSFVAHMSEGIWDEYP